MEKIKCEQQQEKKSQCFSKSVVVAKSKQLTSN
jgi:hypothetical protein